MTLRAGSANMTRPKWRGVIREDSFPWALCTHTDHENQRQATRCGREALAQYQRDGTLPDHWLGWKSWHQIYDRSL
jgi:hypothetical protein